MADTKPPTTLKIAIQTLGKREDVADLFEQLNALGVLDRSLDITLNVGAYFEFQGRELRRQVHDLIKEHPAILRTKSYVQLVTKTGADDRLLENPEDIEAEPDDEEPEETPLERYAREQEGSLAGRVFESVAEQINAGALDRDGTTVRASVVRRG